ncbi:MAG: alanine racemase, partial [Gemmatimonadales bacterium]
MTTSIPAETARAWADIDLAAVVANARTVERAAGTRLLPMIKADAYGLGAVPVARALEEIEPWGYGVATTPEAATLREAGVDRPLIVFTPLLPSQIEACLELHLRPVIGDLEALVAWTSRTARPFHLEIDTGMARSGIRWNDRAALGRAGDLLSGSSGWEGVFTHFHSPDDAPATMAIQWERFQDALAALPSRPPLVHAASSAAALRDRRFAADMVRPGIFLYGGRAGGHTPRTALRLHARVVSVRTLTAGESVS